METLIKLFENYKKADKKYMDSVEWNYNGTDIINKYEIRHLLSNRTKTFNKSYDYAINKLKMTDAKWIEFMRTNV